MVNSPAKSSSKLGLAPGGTPNKKGRSEVAAPFDFAKIFGSCVQDNANHPLFVCAAAGGVPSMHGADAAAEEDAGDILDLIDTPEKK